MVHKPLNLNFIQSLCVYTMIDNTYKKKMYKYKIKLKDYLHLKALLISSQRNISLLE